MAAEAETLERGANILAKTAIAGNGPAVTQLGQAIQILLRNEAERTRFKLRGGKSLRALFPDYPADEAAV